MGGEDTQFGGHPWMVSTNAPKILSAMTLKIFAGCNNKGESPVEADLVRRSSDQRALGPHSRTLRLQVSDGHTILLSGVPFPPVPVGQLFDGT